MKKTLMIPLILFGACSPETDDIGIKGKEMKVEADVQVFGEAEGYSWQDEDMIGVSVEGMADYYTETNMAFSYDSESAGFRAVNEGIILKGAERTLLAYYPFKGPEKEVPEQYSITTTAQWQTETGMKENDYLFASTTVKRENPVASFEFHHVLSLLKLEFEESAGKTGEISYTLQGLLHKGSFNPYTGEVSLTTTKSEDITLSSSDMTGTLMLVPQTSEVAISLTFEGKTYATTFTAELSSGTAHVYKVHISPENLDAALSITDAGTADWTVGQGGDIESEDNLEISVSDAGSAATKAYTDESFRTTFEKGDKVGVFAIRNGAVLPNINNRALTFNGSEWEFDSKVNYNATMQGAVFHAYYPYSEEAVADAGAADPFAAMAEGWTVPYDQSTQKKYHACDLMTASATPVEKDGKFHLDFGMTHRMGMLQISLPKTAYVFTNTDPELEDYVLTGWSAAEYSASIGSEPAVAILPLMDEASQSHRFIVKPGTPVNISATFSRDGAPKKFSLSLQQGIGAGVCEPYRVDGGYRKTVMELKVGDYYCTDGSLVPYDGSVPAPENAVGVVYMVGTPAAVSTSEPDFTHGLVYSLARQKRPAVEGDPGKYSKFEGDEYVSVFGLAQDKNYDYSSIGLSTGDHNKTDLNGYGYTKSWMLYNGELGMNAIFLASIQAYREANPLPEGMTTEWYLPSYDEFVKIAENKEALDASLAHASAEASFEGAATGDKKYFRGHWTSSLRSTGAVVNYYVHGDEDPNNSGVKQTGYVESRYGMFRYAFAF